MLVNIGETQRFLRELRCSGLTAQQKRTLRGQAINGYLDAAKKGYQRLMRDKENSRKDETA